MIFKKSQVTAFIILGLVILSGTAAFIYITTSGQENLLQRQAQESAIQKTDSNIIVEYVTSCLKKTSEEAIQKITAQGGALYLDNAEITKDSSSIFSYQIGGKDTFTHIAIKKSNVLGTDAKFPLPPTYPKADITPLLVKPFAYSQKDNFPLCDPAGVNRAQQGQTVSCASTAGYNLYGERSIQKQLEEYTSIKLEECVKKELLESVTVFDINLSKPNVTYFLADENTIIKANYPISLTFDENFIKEDHFEVSLQIRLKRLYDLINFMIFQDSYYLDFDFRNEFDRKKFRDYDNYFYDSITLDKICPLCDERNFTRVVRITDSKSIVNNNPLVFTFAVENRIPALDYLHRDVSSLYTSIFPGIKLDYVFLQGSQIAIKPKAYDPDDDDKLTFEYAGWLADDGVDQDFNWVCCTQSGTNGVNVDCKSREIVTCQIDVPNMGSGDGNWKTTKLGLPNDKLNEDNRSIQLRSIGLNGFSEDFGLHKMKITVYDEEGLSDWQDITVLVHDEPRPIITLRKIYPSVSSANILSLEDPYTFSAENSVSFFGVEAVGFKWEILHGSIIKTFETPDAELIIPQESYDILNIKGFISPLIFSSAGSYTVRLYTTDSAGTQSATSDEKTITVQACIPNAGTGNTYPYGNSANDFDTAHACCNAGNVASTGNCFTAITYAGANNFYSNKFASNENAVSGSKTIIWKNLGNLDIPPSEKQGDKINPSSKYANDVFSRTYTRTCDGERGNICGGDIIETYKGVVECADKQLPEIASCQGPQYNGEQLNSFSCKNYDYYESQKTFEGVDFCNEVTKCIDPFASSLNYKTSPPNSGKFECKAGCDNGECKARVDCKFTSSCGAQAQCANILFSAFGARTYACVGTAGSCDRSGLYKSVDQDETTCSVCHGNTQGITPKLIGSNCCGNNPNEYPRQISGSWQCCNSLAGAC